MLVISAFKMASVIFMGLLIVAAFLFFALLLRGGSTKEEETFDIPGKEVEEETPVNVKIIDIKDVPEFDFRFSERPYNPYELYN